MKKMAVFIRKLTDVHIVAILMFLTIRFCKPDFFEGKYVFILMLVSIGIIPLLNYPVSPFMVEIDMLIHIAPSIQNVRSIGNLIERIVIRSTKNIANTAMRFTLVLSFEITFFRSLVDALVPAIYICSS